MRREAVIDLPVRRTGEDYFPAQLPVASAVR